MLFKVDTIYDAREKILERAKQWRIKTETVSLSKAQNRILSGDLFAPLDVPGFERATVDGYAVVSSDTQGASEAIPVLLKLAGSVQMGRLTGFSIKSGECAYVPTGGMLPPGADAVVMLEYCENSGGHIAVGEAAAAGAGMAILGEDFKKGELLLRRGTKIRAKEAGALAAAGVSRVSVFSPIKAAIISTGDELVSPEKEPCPGEVRDINSQTLKAKAEKCNYDVVFNRILPDNSALLEEALAEAINECDLVIVSGGSSKGEKDLTLSSINHVSKPGAFTHGLAMKPGKPTILGWDEEKKKLLSGLPGHPVAALMVFEILFRWLSDKIFCCAEPFAIPASLSCNVPGAPGRTLCQPVMLHFADGAYSAEPVFGKSGMITTLTKADGYILLDLNKEGLNSGDQVLVHLL